jgi:amino acid transporter
MFDLERTRKVEIAFDLLAALSLVVSIISLFSYDSLNLSSTTLLLFVSFGVFLVSLLGGIGFHALRKDISENMRYLQLEADRTRKSS